MIEDPLLKISPSVGFMQGRLSPVRNQRIQSFPWRHWEEEFYIAGKLGFTKIEWTIDSERFLENPILTSPGIKKILQLSNRHGVTIPSVTCDYFMENPFWENEGQVIRENLVSILNGMQEIKARILVIPLIDNSSIRERNLSEEVVNFFKTVERDLAIRGLKIAFESDFDPESLLAFISKFDSKYFGINYDIGNSASFGYNPVEEFSAYGSQIINIHVKDRILGGTTVPLGEGAVNFKSIFKLINKFGYKGNLIMQTARADEGMHEAMLLKYQSMILRWQKETVDAS